MSIESTFRDEIMSELDEVSKLNFGSDEYKAGINGLAQLTECLNRLIELDSEDAKLELERAKLDLEIEKFKEDKADRKKKNHISVLGIVAPATIAIVGGFAMFVYEERGSITSQVGRKIIDKYIFRVK